MPKIKEDDGDLPEISLQDLLKHSMKVDANVAAVASLEAKQAAMEEHGLHEAAPVAKASKKDVAVQEALQRENAELKEQLAAAQAAAQVQQAPSAGEPSAPAIPVPPVAPAAPVPPVPPVAPSGPVVTKFG